MAVPLSPVAILGLGFSLGWPAVIAVAAAFALLLVAKSIKDFSQTGPQLKQEVAANYRGYLVYALARLGAWTFALTAAMAAAGVLVYTCAAVWLGLRPSASGMLLAAIAGFGGLSALQLCRTLFYVPATFAASSQYQMRRFVKLWHRLSAGRVRALALGFALPSGALAAAALWRLADSDAWAGFAALGTLIGAIVAGLRWACGPAEPAKRPSGHKAERPNIVMIGSDTLRADRLGQTGYRRALTPFIDALASRGALFGNCFVPCARTAPSLLSMLTGCWPHTHGVRDNFVADAQTHLPVAALPQILSDEGYATAVVGDWAAADLGKFHLGFQGLDLPDDQWNMKYFLRQGPKDIRLFLSMFTRNRFGKTCLPELYYLGGIPLTQQVGRDARAKISDLAAGEKPFLLNVFMASTHPPFGSDHPYYTLYADPAYDGESKFAMARLTDPFEIIRRQGDGRKEFDLDQVIDLYDGCVKSFDDEVRRIVGHIDALGLRENTIIVIYSDHGMEFFERDTWGQGNSVHSDVSPRIPLVMVDPRRPAARRHDFVTRSIDIAPTLLDLAGVAPAAHMEGVSLAPWLAGEQADPQLVAYNETGIWLTELPGMPPGHLRYPNLMEILEVPDIASGTLGIKADFRHRVIEAKDRMLRRGSWKLIYRPMEDGPVYELYDALGDPECAHDVAASHPDVVAGLRAQMQCWLSCDAAPATA